MSDIINIDTFVEEISTNEILSIKEINPNSTDVMIKLFMTTPKYKFAKYINHTSFDKLYAFSPFEDIITNIRLSKPCTLYIDDKPTNYYVPNVTLPMTVVRFCKIELRSEFNNCELFYDVYRFATIDKIYLLMSNKIRNNEGMCFWEGITN